MTVFEIGRVCIKIRGRHAGKKVAVVLGPEKGFVEIEGAGIKKKRCNMMHLFATRHKIGIAKNSPRAEVEKLLKGVRLDG